MAGADDADSGDGAAVQQVLVHIDAGLGPIGAWSFNDGHLVHFYPESLDTSIPARAREAMASRDLDVSVPDWFALLADQDPTMLDAYEAFTVDIPVALPTILAEYRRQWNANV
jgi:hypothetical protein